MQAGEDRLTQFDQWDYNRRLSDQDFQNSWVMAERANQWEMIQSDFNAQLQLQLMERENAYKQSNLALENRYALERMAVEQGYTLEQMAESHGYTLEQMEQGFFFDMERDAQQIEADLFKNAENIDANLQGTYLQMGNAALDRYNNEVISILQNGEMSAAQQQNAINAAGNRLASDMSFIEGLFGVTGDSSPVGNVGDGSGFAPVDSPTAGGLPSPSNLPASVTDHERNYYTNLSHQQRDDTNDWFDMQSPQKQAELVSQNSGWAIWSKL